MKFTPHTYQKFATQKIIKQPAVGLFLDMGLGKTVCALTAASELLHNYYEVSKVLVIAPYRVARDTWPAEIAKWDHLQYLKLSVVLGPPKERITALHTPADIYVINRENVVWLVNYYGGKWPFDMVIIDELSNFKSPKAKRFRALRKVRPLIKRIVGLTGTPAPNGLIDLWAQIYLLDQGERLGKTITGYKNRYFVPGRRNQHIIYDWVLKPEAEEAIYKKISDICVSMKSEDWLKMPEVIYREIKVKLPEEAREKYDQLERDLLLPYANGDVIADTAATLTGKLLQMANGAVYNEFKEVQTIHDAKLDALEDVIEAANGKPILVFYAFRHDLAGIQRRFPEAKILDKAEDIQAWNEGKISIALVHPGSAGHGLNLQAGGNIIVWFGLTWSLELYTQANARLNRQGQKHKNVIIHHLVAEDTIDEDVMKSLENKDRTQEALMRAVKARIQKVFGKLEAIP